MPAPLSVGAQGRMLWKSTLHPAEILELTGDHVLFKFPKSKGEFLKTDPETARREFMVESE